MSLKQLAIKGTIWSSISQWANKFLSLATFTILARLLDPDSFGLIALAGTFLAFLGLFLDQGFSTAIVQRKNLEPEHLDTAFWTNIAISVTITTFCITGAGFAANFFSEPSLTPVIRWLSLSFVIASFNSVQSALFSRKLNFKLPAICSLISSFSGAIVGITMAFMGFGVWSLVTQQLSGGIVSAFVLWTASDWRPRFRFSRKHLNDLFAFGLNIVGINILAFFVTKGDNLLIGYFLGATALGYYDLAYRLLLVVTSLFVGIITSTAMPIFSSIQDDLPRLRKVLYEFVELTNTLAFPIFLGMSVLAPELVIVIFGEQWKASIPVMQILSIAGLSYGGFYFNAPLIMAMGKPDWKLKLDVYRAFVYCFSFLIGVNWGIIGVSLGFVLSAYLGSSWVTVLLIQRLVKIKISTYLNKFSSSLINSLIMGVVIVTARYLLFNNISPDIVSLMVLSSLGASTYTISLYILSNNSFVKILQVVRHMYNKTT
ncbi:MAG: MOP flippase family protein [Cyanobacteriota bacterium]